VYRLGILLLGSSSYEVKRSVRLIEKLLAFERFQAYNFEAASTSDAKFRLEEVDIRGVGRYIEFLQKAWLAFLLAFVFTKLTLKGLRASWLPWNKRVIAGLPPPLESVSIGSKTFTVVDIPDVFAVHTKCRPRQTPALKKLAWPWIFLGRFRSAD
jgi:hypothetical protein